MQEKHSIQEIVITYLEHVKTHEIAGWDHPTITNAKILKVTANKSHAEFSAQDNFCYNIVVPSLHEKYNSRVNDGLKKPQGAKTQGGAPSKKKPKGVF